MITKLRLWRGNALTWFRAMRLAVLIRILRVNAWLNTASIFVLVALGAVLGLAVIVAMISAGVRG